MSSRLEKHLKTLPLAVACACAPLTAAAQTLEEVVVTAQKRSQSLQDVPISISAVSGEKLNEAGITRISDLQVYVPNLNMSEAAIGSNIYIRGVGSQVNQGFEQSVGTYVDGIYFGRPRQLRAPFFDLERVEVLRGPQSILFGKNSIAGALNLVTSKPTEAFEGSVSALYEPDHGELDTSVILSGPLTDNVAGRLAVRYREMDGFIDNVAKDSEEMETDETLIRAALRWDATENLLVDLKLETGEFNSEGRNSIIIGSPAPGGATPVVGDFTRKAALDPEFSDNNYDNATLTLNYQLGDYELVSISGWSAYDYNEEVDTDFGVGSTVQSPADEDFEQFSQELRLVSPLGRTFEHIVGVFYQVSKTDYSEPAQLDLPAVAVEIDRDFYSDSDLWAVFGQSTWNISTDFRATLGLRYTVEDKDGGRRLALRNPDGSIFNPLNMPEFAELGMPLPGLGITPHDLSGKRNEEVITPLLNLQWDVAEEAMLYASVSTGYKAGGFDARSNRATFPDGRPALEFEEEEALSMEIGAKLGLLDNAAELNIAVFRTEYDDLQVSVFDGVLGFDVQNAASATTQGVEMDGRWQVTDKLRLTGAMAYTDFEFDDYENGACYKGQTPSQVVGGVAFCDWQGNTNQFTPEFSGTLGINFVQPVLDNLELSTAVDVIYSDDYFAAPDLDPQAVQDSYVKLNARIALGRADGVWEVALVGRNLTDEEIITFANDVPLTGPVTSYFAFVERPRTVAVQATYNF
ncbi:MAG: TonB-dependent receptor [Gammaproteobacteria bacterium]|nr:TonB-dependent receptor [Gammaproteobacteria bacterium]